MLQICSPCQPDHPTLPSKCNTLNLPTCPCCTNIFFQRKTVRNKPFCRPLRASMPGENARPSKKKLAAKKEWLGKRTTADHGGGGARACTEADGAVVLNLRRGSGAYVLLLRADGQLTRAARTTTTWTCGLPARSAPFLVFSGTAPKNMPCFEGGLRAGATGKSGFC